MRRMVGAVAVAALVAGCSGHDATDPSADAGPAPATGEPDQIDWETNWSMLRAREFSIEAGGTRFVVGDADVAVNADYVPDGYTTIEGTWHEHDVEMRLYIYLYSDGVQWWTDEIRTYDGTVPGEWITYEGDWFRSPIGHAYLGELHLETPPDAPIPGRLDLTGLVAQAFIEPTCDGAAFTVRSWARFIDMPLSPTVGFRNLVDVLDADCNPVDDLTPFALSWELDDPIATVEWDGVGWNFRPKALGETLAHLSLYDAATSELLSEIAIPVTVYEEP